MAIIHTNIPKRRARKPDAKARELKSSWEAMLKKYETKPIQRLATMKSYSPPKPFVRETPRIPSLDTGGGLCSKKEVPKYTGTAMIGIGTLHKSNAVPVFSQEDAIEISRMRRG
jgi:hypothetical protein